MSLTRLQPTGDGADPLAEFRAMCRTMGTRQVPPMDTIVSVGACHDPREGLWINDRFWLGAVLECCQQMQMPVAENFSYTPLNIAYKDGEEVPFNAEEDYIDPALTFPADIVIFSYVFNPRTERHFKYVVDSHPAYRTSPHHFEEGAYHNAILRSGAKLVFTIVESHKPREIDVDDIWGPEFFQGPGMKRVDLACVRKDLKVNGECDIHTLVRKEWAGGMPMPFGGFPHSLQHSHQLT